MVAVRIRQLCGEKEPGLARLHPLNHPGANLKSISHRCYLWEVAFEWDLTKKTYIVPWVVSRVKEIDRVLVDGPPGSHLRCYWGSGLRSY